MATELELAALQSADEEAANGLAIDQQTADGQELARPRKLLRAVNPDLYDLFTERLEEQRIHSYDVQLIVEENEADPNDGLTLKVLFGEWYSNVFEKPVSRADLEVDSPEMETFLTELIAACEESLILDYRKFMQPHT
jgi:hypothetical protein